MTTEKLVLTEEAEEILSNEGYELFNSINEYVNYIFSETNFHDGMTMLKILENKIDDYILTQETFQFIANTENTHLDIEQFFLDLEFEGEIFE